MNRLAVRGGEPRTLTISRAQSGSWRASVGFRNVAARRLAPSDQVGGVDRGVAVTAALPDGTLLEMPGFLAEARDRIAELSRVREAHPKGSVGWRQANKAIAKEYRRARHRSENWARHTAIGIVAAYGVIALEALRLPNMTRSAKGTVENPGKGVAAKRGLNRSLQDAALGRLAWWICVGAEDAGRRVYKVDPRNTSRQCAECGHHDPANRPSRSRFCCQSCGHEAHADVNAANNIAARGQAADTAWKAAGSPLLTRPTPRNRRHRTITTPPQGAGSAPHSLIPFGSGPQQNRPGRSGGGPAGGRPTRSEPTPGVVWTDPAAPPRRGGAPPRGRSHGSRDAHLRGG